MLEGIEGVATRVGEIQDKIRQFCGGIETKDPSGARDFASVLASKSSEVDAIIREKSSHLGLDERLVKSVVAVESNFDPKAVSPKGAAGLMQLMPETARRMGVQDVFNPGENVAGGTRYLKEMLDRFGNNLPLALAGYNAGPAAVEKAGNKIPDYAETKDYVRKVMSLYDGTEEE